MLQVESVRELNVVLNENSAGGECLQEIARPPNPSPPQKIGQEVSRWPATISTTLLGANRRRSRELGWKFVFVGKSPLRLIALKVSVARGTDY